MRPQNAMSTKLHNKTHSFLVLMNTYKYNYLEFVSIMTNKSLTGKKKKATQARSELCQNSAQAKKKIYVCFLLPDRPCLKSPDPNWFIDSMGEEKRKTYFWFMWINFKSNWQIQDMSKLILQVKYTYVYQSLMYNICFKTLQHCYALQFFKKIIKKKKSWPTDPIIFSYVTGNKHIFLFGLSKKWNTFRFC